MKRADAEQQLQNTEPGSPERRLDPAVRLPYRRPVLRHLGSVRDLALGSAMGAITDMMGGLRRL